MATLIAVILAALHEPKSTNEDNVEKEANNNTQCNVVKKCDLYTDLMQNTGEKECVNSFQHKDEVFIPMLVERSSFEKVIDCFSLSENFKSVSKTTIAPSSIPVINGFK